MSTADVSRLDAHELRRLRARGEALVPVDVRTADARLAKPIQIPGARWLPLADVARHATTLPRDATIVTYCT